MSAKTVEDLLAGPTEISWMLFEHVRPIIAEYLQTGRVLSIDDVFKKQGRNATVARKEAEDKVVEGANAWIEEGLQDLYAVQGFFEREMRKADEPKSIDTHMYTTYGEFHNGFTGHARRMIKISNLPEKIVDALNTIIKFNPESKGIDLCRSVYLGMRHGELRITDNPSYPIVFQVSRIKDARRLGNKFARYACEAIMEWKRVQSYLDGKEKKAQERDKKIGRGLNKLLSGNKDEKKMGEKIIENFGAMHAYELRTPFSEEEVLQITEKGVDAFEYILMRSRVSDVLGAMDVVRDEKEVTKLMERAKNGRFVGKERYNVLLGKRLQREGNEWGYTDKFIVDDQERRIFTYAIPKRRLNRYNIRIDYGLEALKNYAEDAVGGEKSHILHEARQEAKIKTWARDIRRLYLMLSNAASFPLERLDIKRHEVYKGFSFQQEGARAK